jgi:hypothetical protein
VTIEDVGNTAAFLCRIWPTASPAKSLMLTVASRM